jgi:lipoate synthase
MTQHTSHQPPEAFVFETPATKDCEDIPDGGAQHFASTVELLKHKKPKLPVKSVVLDFQRGVDGPRRPERWPRGAEKN